MTPPVDEQDDHRLDSFTLFVAGDVMTGRGIDQVLPHPGDPRIYEPYSTSALDYVKLAERTSGPIPRWWMTPISGGMPWQRLTGPLPICASSTWKRRSPAGAHPGQARVSSTACTRTTFPA